MRRWRTKSNVELLVAMILVVGGLLCAIVWMTQNAKASSNRSLSGISNIVGPQRAAVTVSAVLPAVLPATLPRACAAALRAAAVKDASAITRVDTRDDVR